MRTWFSVFVLVLVYFNEHIELLVRPWILGYHRTSQGTPKSKTSLAEWGMVVNPLMFLYCKSRLQTRWQMKNDHILKLLDTKKKLVSHYWISAVELIYHCIRIRRQYVIFRIKFRRTIGNSKHLYTLEKPYHGTSIAYLIRLVTSHLTAFVAWDGHCPSTADVASSYWLKHILSSGCLCTVYNVWACLFRKIISLIVHIHLETMVQLTT